jgi:Sulfotransferase family
VEFFFFLFPNFLLRFFCCDLRFAICDLRFAIFLEKKTKKTGLMFLFALEIILWILLTRFLFHVYKVVAHQRRCSEFERHSTILWPIEAFGRLIDDAASLRLISRVATFSEERLCERALNYVRNHGAENVHFNDANSELAGSNAVDWQRRFKLLVERGQQSEKSMTFFGRVTACEFMNRHLVNRLLVNRWLAENRQQVDRALAHEPIFIAGMFRTGTTYLHHMLSRDPALRAPTIDEMLAPVECGAMHSRRFKTFLETSVGSLISPRLSTLHHRDAGDPEECFLLFDAEFANDLTLFMFPRELDAQVNDILSTDFAPVYRYFAAMLRCLEAHGGGGANQRRWLLKCPMHTHRLAGLFAQFPGAMIVHTHRNPIEAVASTASLFATIAAGFADNIDLAAIGRVALRLMTAYWNAAIDARDAFRDGGEQRARFYDVSFRQLVTKPIDTTEAIYRHFALPFGAEQRNAFELYQLEYRRRVARFDKHNYALAEFGLTKRDVRTSMARYYNRFSMYF